MERKRALEGVRVIDFTWILAGPYCTRFLADFGAEVIKVQSAERAQKENVSGYFNFWNRNKLGVTINMATPKGRDVCKQLIRLSDVVVENFSARVLRQWGLDWENARKVNPDIIVVSLPGMGHTGPMRDYVSFGPTLQAMTGITALSSFPGHAPQGYGYSYADHVGGLTGAMAVLQALNYRQRTGKGQFVDAAQLEGLSVLMSTSLLQCTINGKPPEPAGNRIDHPLAVPHDVFRCLGDDRWVAITVFSEEEWQAFCKAIGSPAWAQEPRFATAVTRKKHVDELDRLITEWTSQRSAEEIMHLLQSVGVRAGVVQTAEDLIERDPQLRARNFWVQSTHPDFGECSFDSTPMKFSATPQEIRRASPTLGQDNEYVFEQLMGMSKQEIEQLTEERVLR